MPHGRQQTAVPHWMSEYARRRGVRNIKTQQLAPNPVASTHGDLSFHASQQCTNAAVDAVAKRQMSIREFWRSASEKTGRSVDLEKKPQGRFGAILSAKFKTKSRGVRVPPIKYYLSRIPQIARFETW